MDPISIAVAFLLGFGARTIGLPPLVGFLVAGFVLQGVGVAAGDTLQSIADLGVTLLLFTIGLKLKLETLGRPEVWGGASLHALITVAGFGLLFAAFIGIGLPAFTELDAGAALLVAFALSFSSTVFAVKVLEEKGELRALHGRTAIGILIMQDVFAVVFLGFSAGKVPSIWALGLIPGLLLIRPLLTRLLDRIGHDELMPLFGLFAALTLGAAAFDLVHVKADLGALILGMLLASHKRASEIADSLFAFKEVFLVGFFLSIGLRGVPTTEGFFIAFLLVLLIPLKVALFFYLLTRFRFRARSALLGALALANYSEFGLIVAAIGVDQGWLDGRWLVIVALALSVSFVLASPLNAAAQRLYARFRPQLRPFERAGHHPDEAPIDLGRARIAIFGMGRVGAGAYDYLRERWDEQVVGIEIGPARVAHHQAEGRNVIQGDATDRDFWDRIAANGDGLQVVMLAMPDHASNLYALEQIRATGFEGYVAAVGQYQDEILKLEQAGAHVAFNTHAEAGYGFGASIEREIAGVAGLRPRPALGDPEL
jgi:predicted Kef-type K+ transport protein